MTRPFDPTSFEAWVLDWVQGVLGRRVTPAPWLLWCDPSEEWRDLLRLAARDGEVELWEADPTLGAHGELVLRHRFAAEPRRPRVVWVPTARERLGWFKVFELEATVVWEQGLLEALREYGVHIRRSDEEALVPLLVPHAREWFAQPNTRWAELTPGNAKGALVDDERVFHTLAGPSGAFAELAEDGRFEVFARRVMEDFGLPRPETGDEEGWRVGSLARLLATEAAEASPGNAPAEGDRIIPPGPARTRALRLLRQWASHIHGIATLEFLVPKADAQLGLRWWARDAQQPPRSRLSRAVEEALFDGLVERLERVEDLDRLARDLEAAAPTILDRAEGFWAKVAGDRVPWAALAELARAASALLEHADVHNSWTRARDAARWYSERGWQLDAECEGLFVEKDDLPSPLRRLRVRLRRGYLRALDRAGQRFSTLLAASPEDVLGMPSAGEVLQAEVEARKGPLAIVFLDACRYDLGQRLARLLNEGEPQQRAEVSAAVAPLPSITALGMALALPIPRASLKATFDVESRRFRVQAEGFSGDLTQKQNREKWLTSRLKAAQVLTVNDVLSDQFDPASPRSKRLVVVHGAEVDKSGHEGELELTGAGADIERYAKAIRRLRDRGFGRVVVVTDHGYFHWQPEADELEADKPSGAVHWSSRRAIVGAGLAHPTALVLPVTCSELQVALPRSVMAWRTYGGLGFFHGGALLQELVIPVVKVSWPTKATKVGVVLKPIGQLTTRRPRVEVQITQEGLFASEGLLGRRVQVKVQDRQGRIVFRHDEPVLIEIGTPERPASREPRPVQLELVPSLPEGLAFGAELIAVLRDADDDEELARETVRLKVELDDWD